tara:strand:+ start:2003 stop:2281 length:279 start_codon:yes stop_codon:yes gene_type:complete
MSSAAVVLMDHWREAKIKQQIRHASLVQEAEDYLKDSNKEIHTLYAAATMVCDHSSISASIEQRLERCSHPRGYEDYEVISCDVCQKVINHD